MQTARPLAPPQITRLRQGLRDALLPFLIAIPGGLALGLYPQGTDVLPMYYLSHAWLLAIVGFWIVVFRVRFPIGRLTRQSLHGWFWPWLIVGGLDVANVIQGPGSGLHHAILAQFVFNGIVVGPAEELLFRGLIQTTLNRAIGGAGLFGRLRWGTIIASVVFGAAHLVNLGFQPLGMTLEQVAFATIIGLVLGYYYDRTQNLWGAAILHNIIDFMGVFVPFVLVG